MKRYLQKNTHTQAFLYVHLSHASSYTHTQAWASPLAISSVSLVSPALGRLQAEGTSWASPLTDQGHLIPTWLPADWPLPPLFRKEGRKDVIPAAKEAGSCALVFPKPDTCNAKLSSAFQPLPCTHTGQGYLRVDVFVCLGKQIASSYAAPWIILFLNMKKIPTNFKASCSACFRKHLLCPHREAGAILGQFKNHRCACGGP